MEHTLAASELSLLPSAPESLRPQQLGSLCAPSWARRARAMREPGGGPRHKPRPPKQTGPTTLTDRRARARLRARESNPIQRHSQEHRSRRGGLAQGKPRLVGLRFAATTGGLVQVDSHRARLARLECEREAPSFIARLAQVQLSLPS